MHYTNSILAALLAITTRVVATDVTRNPSLDSALFTQATQLDRLTLLGSNSDWAYDFSAQSTYNFAPGSVVNANAATFPAAVDNELTMAVINLGPCAMLPPHYHPRAANYVVAISGNTTTYMIEENGAQMITEVLTPMMMTIFPRGSLHAMQNTGCTNAQLISALSNTDQGTHNVVNGLFQMPQNVINAAFGNPSSDVKFKKIPAVGAGAIVGDTACLARCAAST